MISPLLTTAFTPQTATRSEIYTDKGKQSLISTADASTEMVAKNSHSQQEGVNHAQQQQDTVEISDTAREMLQQTVNKPDKGQKNSTDDTGSGSKNTSDISHTGAEATKSTEDASPSNVLRERLKEAQKELREAMEQAAQAQAKLANAKTEQEQVSAQSEVEMAQQRVLAAQQAVQTIFQKIMEAEKSA